MGRGGWRWSASKHRAPPEGSARPIPACWVCLTLQTGPTATSVGLRVPAGGRTRWHQPLPAQLSTNMHSARPAAWREMDARWGAYHRRPSDLPHSPTPAGPHPRVPLPGPAPLPTSPGQGCRAQGALSCEAPGHGAPPFLGGGSTQLLWRLRWPPPQETLQGPQAPQAAHAPATVREERTDVDQVSPGRHRGCRREQAAERSLDNGHSFLS